MRTHICCGSLALLLVAGCATRTATKHVAVPPGVPVGAPSTAVLDRVAPAAVRAKDDVPKAAPDMIRLPAAYRYLLVDGKPTLVRETDEQAIRLGPSSLRVVVGEISRGEISYQPALLPQELATELVKVRQAQRGFDEANLQLRSQSDELLSQARLMQAQNLILVQRLGQVASYARDLEKQQATPTPPPVGTVEGEQPKSK